jgi:hypothetical protein
MISYNCNRVDLPKCLKVSDEFIGVCSITYAFMYIFMSLVAVLFHIVKLHVDANNYYISLFLFFSLTLSLSLSYSLSLSLSLSLTLFLSLSLSLSLSPGPSPYFTLPLFTYSLSSLARTLPI